MLMDLWPVVQKTFGQGLETDLPLPEKRRLAKPLSRSEFFALILCVGVLFSFAYLHKDVSGIGYDYSNGIAAGRGDLSIYWFAAWALPFYAGLAYLPFEVGFCL